jgi:hypothetical protein
VALLFVRGGFSRVTVAVFAIVRRAAAYVGVGHDDQADDDGRDDFRAQRLLCESTCLQAPVASYANAAAHRAVITITADHPSRGDAWVVRRTARCGNVVQC